MDPYVPQKTKMPKAGQRGTLILIVIILAILSFRYFYKFPEPEPQDFSEFQKQIEEIYRIQEEESNCKQKYFVFNPNTASYEELMRLGLPSRLVKTLLKYRKAGGAFYLQSDLRKVYGMNDSILQLLKPYIDLPNKKPVVATKQKISTKQKQLRVIDKEAVVLEPEPLVDLNSADSLKLLMVKGIGPVFSHRILKYRKLLGGYVNKKQLLEVYGLSDEVYMQIEKQVFVTEKHILQTNLNTATFKQINKHPYISYNQTKSIVRYRDIMDQFDSVPQLIYNHLLDSSSYQKVAPYLCVN